MTEPAVDVLVIGAGPAGLAAAVAAARAGAHRVVLLDAEARPGGQYWRHGPGGLDQPVRHPQLWAQLAALAADGRIQHRAGHRVWRVESLPDVGPRLGPRSPTALVHAVRTGADGTDHPVTLSARALVLATGAHDRVLPFPGWDLPGVVTAGAAQALLKEHGVPVGRRVVIGGTGPFLLPVATGLLAAGVEVVALCEAGNGAGWLAGGRAALGAAGRVTEAAGYARTLLRHRVRPGLRRAVLAAHGSDRVEAVTVARLAPDWQPVPGSERRLACDAVVLGWGFTARLELALQLGAATGPGPDGAAAITVDPNGRTSVLGVWAAGELTGIGGVDLAVVEGRMAGADAAAHAAAGSDWSRPGPVDADSERDRRALTAFAAVMHAAHPVLPGWAAWLTDDTLVCRCEEVSLGALRTAVDELAGTDPRTAKLLTRCGMGWCQGRMCGEAVTRLVTGKGPAAGPGPELGDRPVAVPITLGALSATLEADTDEHSD